MASSKEAYLLSAAWDEVHGGIVRISVTPDGRATAFVPPSIAEKLNVDDLVLDGHPLRIVADCPRFGPTLTKHAL